MEGRRGIVRRLACIPRGSGPQFQLDLVSGRCGVVLRCRTGHAPRRTGARPGRCRHRGHFSDSGVVFPPFLQAPGGTEEPALRWNSAGAAADAAAPGSGYRDSFSASAMLSSKMSRAISASCSLRTRGGARRMEFSPQPRMSRPRSKASSTMRSRRAGAVSRVF